jgi:hypothetical protein
VREPAGGTRRTRRRGSYAEPDEAVRGGRAAIDSIDSSRSIYPAIETLFFGLSLGSVLVLVAIGLAITFGVMGVINMAHGELMMLGAYTTYVVQTAMPDHLEMSILVAIPAAFLVPASRASCSSAPSSGSSTAARSRRCSPPSASACCCSSSSLGLLANNRTVVTPRG